MRERLNDSRTYEIELVVRETENGEPRKIVLVVPAANYAEARARAIAMVLNTVQREL